MRRLFAILSLLAVFAISFWASQALAQWGDRGYAPTGPVGSLVPAPPPQHPDQVWLIVELDDPAAELYLGGRKMQQTGLVRHFISPHLPKGRYTYQIEVHWAGAMKMEVVSCKPGNALKVVMVRPGAVKE